MPKVNNRPTGEISPILVTLKAKNLAFLKKALKVRTFIAFQESTLRMV
jgi:hypothetical protein